MHQTSAPDKFFKEVTIPASQTDFLQPGTPDLDFGFRATALMLILDEGKALEWSFNARRLDGKIICEDRSIVFDMNDISKVWFRNPSGGDCKLRVWAWLRQK